MMIISEQITGKWIEKLFVNITVRSGACATEMQSPTSRAIQKRWATALPSELVT